MKAIPDYGDLMPLKDWIDCVKCGGFNNYDGNGKLATETKMTNIKVKPSDVKDGKLETAFTHIVWFNR